MSLFEVLSLAGVAKIGYVLARYGHVVASMLLIGGLLFHEMVVPHALSDEKEETQRALFARTRWAFHRIGWSCLVLILLSGIVMSTARLPSYLRQEYFSSENFSGVAGLQLPIGLRTGWWWVAHTSAGVIAMLIAVSVLSSSRPLAHPIPWLRLDLIVLLVVVFLGSVTHYVNLLHLEQAQAPRTREALHRYAAPERATPYRAPLAPRRPQAPADPNAEPQPQPADLP
jgi:hypothetical protein